MNAEVWAQKLLNRTRYAQNRTKYYTVRNLILSQNERPLFITGSFEEASKDRKLLAIKKAFVNRHYHRRGPFGDLSLPHAYSGIYGDPAYFSLEELVEACTSAPKSDMRDPSFWKQICEKLRKVRDVMEIGDLLRCLSGVVKVNYYDPDLLRMLSREFVDDMDKFDIEQISSLLHCYYKQNVYSCDLVETAGRISISLLEDEYVKSAVVTREEPVQETSIFGIFKSRNPQKQSEEPLFTQKYLSGIARYFAYFGYNNPVLFTSIARIMVSNHNTMDAFTKCVVFASINPLVFLQTNGSLEETDGHDSAISELTKEARMNLVAILDCIRNTIISETLTEHKNDEDEYDMGLLLSSSLMTKETAKLVHDLCRVSSSVKSLSKVALRYVDNLFVLSLVDGRECVDIDETPGKVSHRAVLGALVARISGCMDEMVACMTIIDGGMNGPNEVSKDDHSGLPKNSPYLVAIRNIFVDSLLTTMAVVSSFWRLCCNASVYLDGPSPASIHPPRVQAKVFKFTREDDNVHTLLHERVGKVQISHDIKEVVEKVAKQIEAHGCSGQSVQNLTNTFETLCIMARLNEGHACAGKYKESIKKVSREIIKQLVTFDRESIYRIKLAMNETAVVDVKDGYLEYYVNQFPRFTRLNKRKHRVAFSDPWTHFLNVQATIRRKNGDQNGDQNDYYNSIQSH